MGDNTSHDMRVNVLSGKNPYRTICQELLMATGTINASGTFFRIVAMPPTLNGFTFPVFARVPSGKIKADQCFVFMLFANLSISATDCLGSLRSIFAAPP